MAIPGTILEKRYTIDNWLKNGKSKEQTNGLKKGYMPKFSK